MGLQVSCCVRAQATAESHFRANPSSNWERSSTRLARQKGVPDHRGTPDAGPRAHVHRDSPQASGGFGDRVSEGEERHRHRPAVRQGAELHGRALLGPRLRRIHRRVRTGACPPIHPRARCRGWSRRTILKQPIRRAIARRLDPWPNRL